MPKPSGKSLGDHNSRFGLLLRGVSRGMFSLHGPLSPVLAYGVALNLQFPRLSAHRMWGLWRDAGMPSRHLTSLDHPEGGRQETARVLLPRLVSLHRHSWLLESEWDGLVLHPICWLSDVYPSVMQSQMLGCTVTAIHPHCAQEGIL